MRLTFMHKRWQKILKPRNDYQTKLTEQINLKKALHFLSLKVCNS
jgi:hypothetical protein